MRLAVMAHRHGEVAPVRWVRVLPMCCLASIFACGSNAALGETGTPWWDEPAPADVDADGWTSVDGDCDDLDETVNPEADDACDGRDDDCDGEVDEAFDGDEWEPNDDDATDLGDLEEEDHRLVFGYIFEEADVDRFQVRVVDDDWTWFSLEAWLYGVPADADYALDIRWVEDGDGVDRGIVASADENGDGGYEVAGSGGDPTEDVSGLYEVSVLSRGGAGCASPYTLELILGEW